MQKASLPKGTRDFAPVVLKQRQIIISSISEIYVKYGFEPLETPAMENLSTLTGKYGDEGDKLLFKILNNGNILNDFTYEEFTETFENQHKLISKIAEKGLRYDLTIPFARFVVQNQHTIQLPFKRYQIQPVWRADRPQKGRYREFWQCDADVVGTNSMLCEADFIKIYFEVFTKLELSNYTLKLNHRKVLEAVSITVGYTGKLTDLTVAIDKLDKIGWEGVEKELVAKGMLNEQVEHLKSLLIKTSLSKEALQTISSSLKSCPEAEVGINALSEVINFLDNHPAIQGVELDLSLARGLDYYTGCIFEAVINDAGIGSVSGGGRYDNLTGVFGLDGVSGIGISFGIDRIYDIMLERKLFSEDNQPIAPILFCHFDITSQLYCIKIADKLRAEGIAAEVFPDIKNIRKQMDYANKRGYLFTAVVGDNEIVQDVVRLKNMKTGESFDANYESLINQLK